MIYDKSLKEVWKWKEEVSDSLINLTVKEKLEKIRESTRKRLASRGKSQRQLITSADTVGEG
jgi:hypothetical protein